MEKEIVHDFLDRFINRVVVDGTRVEIITKSEYGGGRIILSREEVRKLAQEVGYMVDSPCERIW